jgi:hypothetical protein
MMDRLFSECSFPEDTLHVQIREGAYLIIHVDALMVYVEMTQHYPVRVFKWISATTNVTSLRMISSPIFILQ